MKNDAIVGTVGDTLQETSFYVPGPRPSQLRHYVLNYHEIATGRFQNLAVGCGSLTVLSTFPVIVLVDGQPLVGDDDLEFLSNVTGVQGWNPTYAAAIQIPVAKPGLAFTLRRKIKTLSILVSKGTQDYLDGAVPGSCHLWFGPDDVEAMDFGLPLSHVLSRAEVGILATSNSFEFLTALHYEGVPPSGVNWQPSRTEVNGIGVFGTWSGAAGIINRVRIQQRGANPFLFTLADYLPNVAMPWDYDFGVPIELPSYQTLPFNADNRGTVRVFVEASASLLDVTVILRCKSWM